MNDASGNIFIGTILLEANRWATPKTPTYRVSEWLDRFREAGFDGMELWEYHATLCSEEERAALVASPFPVSIYNTYCGFDDASQPERDLAADMIRRFGAKGVKFNVGNDPALRDTYLRNLRAWREALPERCRLLCECHGGTIVEEPEAAKRFFDDFGPDKCDIIVHCFISDRGRLKAWFDRFGPSVAHAHVQLRDAHGRADRLDSDPAHVKACLGIMYDAGFQGSFTLEFTEGTGEPDETMDGLWEAALADLKFLRDHLPSL